MTPGRYAPPASGGVSVSPEQSTLPTMLRREMHLYSNVTVIPLSLVLVWGNDLGVPRVLWYSSFLPALAKDFVQWEK